jgi:hypothetical protein
LTVALASVHSSCKFLQEFNELKHVVWTASASVLGCTLICDEELVVE